MEERRRVLHRERSGWSVWLNLLLFGAVGGALFGPVLAGGAAPEPMAWALTLGLVGLIYLLLGGLTVLVESDRIRVGLGSGWPFGTSIALDEIQDIIGYAREMLAAPIDILPGVEETVEALSTDYRLLVITKGDLFDPTIFFVVFASCCASAQSSAREKNGLHPP